MKTKKEIIINSTPSETRIAMLEDRDLAELFVERPQHERTLGNIYKGIVRKVVPGMQAAFVNYGGENRHRS
jgi:ribonuclease G